MNLHGIAGPIVAAVNPTVAASVQVSAGYTIAPGGKQVPAYTTMAGIPAQVQSLTFRDLQQLDGLNLNGTRRAIYLYGEFNGVVRSRIKGGDLVTLTNGPNIGVWLVAIVLEQWDSWCKVGVTLQNEQP